MAIREGRWLCRQCGSENLGRFEECNGLDSQSGCNAARAKGVKFYLPENSPIVTDPNLLADADSGQDWNCDHCDGANKNAYQGHRVTNCVHCGQGRDAQDMVRPTMLYARGSTPSTANEAEPPRASRRKVSPTQSSSHKTSPIVSMRKGSASFIVLLSSLVLLAGFAIWYFFFATFQVVSRVDGFSWERSITIEAYRTVTEEDWDIPMSGREIDEERKIRRYEKVLDHYETKTRQRSEQVATGTESYNCGTQDMGYGYFRDVTCTRTVYSTRYYDEAYQDPVYRDEPIYDIWYTYQIDKWVFDRKPSVKKSDHSPYWPDYLLADNERVSVQSQEYRVHLTTEDVSTHTLRLPLEQW